MPVKTSTSTTQACWVEARASC